MNRVSSPTRESIREVNAEFAAELDSLEENMGFIPQNIMMMTHWPEFTKAFFGLVNATEFSRTISEELQNLVWLAASKASGCRYCEAHMSTRAAHTGTAQEKIDAIYEFETSPVFTDAERAAVRVGFKGGMQATDDEDFEELKKHYSEREIVEICAFIACSGFLNRWNDAMASTLEPEAVNYAMKNLAKHGWEISKHKAATE